MNFLSISLWEHIEEMEAMDGAEEELTDEVCSFEEELEPQDNILANKTDKKKVLSRFELCMLHSSIDKEDQMTVFSDIPFGKTRIILSTNIRF